VKTNVPANEPPREGYGPLPTAQVRRRRAHLSTAKAGILDALIDQPEPCTVAALSAQIGQHPNTIREHLDSLTDAGLVLRTRAGAQGQGRPPWLYIAAPGAGSEPGLREYAALASVLAAQIARTSTDPAIDAVEAGRVWGRQLVSQSPVRGGSVGEGPVSAVAAPQSAVAARRKVVALLDQLGFAPSTDARVGVVKLHRCPLLEVAHQQPEVVCGVHLGIVRGALDEFGADSDHTETSVLKPFSEPGACRLDLLPRAAASR